MKRLFFCLSLGLTILTLSFALAGAQTNWVLYDDFNSGNIDPNLWNQFYSTPGCATISVVAGRLKVEHKPGTEGSIFYLRFKNPATIKAVRVDVEISSFAPGEFFKARIGGHFMQLQDGSLVFEDMYVRPDQKWIIFSATADDPNSYETLYELWYYRFKNPIDISNMLYTLTMTMRPPSASVQGLGTVSIQSPDSMFARNTPNLGIGTKANTSLASGVVYFDNVYVLYDASGMKAIPSLQLLLDE